METLKKHSWLPFLFLAASIRTEVVLQSSESVFTLSPSADIIAFSNFTTNNPLDNLKDFPDTWHPDFDVHEFSLGPELGQEGPLVPDQQAVETSGAQHQAVTQASNAHESPVPHPSPYYPQLDVTSEPSELSSPHPSPVTVSDSHKAPVTVSDSDTASVTVRDSDTVSVTSSDILSDTASVEPLLGPDAWASMYEGVGVQWTDTTTEGGAILEEEEKNLPRRHFDKQLYEVVTASNDPDVQPAETLGGEETQSEKEKYENLQESLKRKYGEQSRTEQEDLQEQQDRLEDMKHPLIMLMKIEPHALDLLVKPHLFVKGTMVRLMYERVPRNRPPLMQHLDDPVVEYVPLHWPAQHHRLQNLPMGKYIVCGEAHMEGQVVQANCFETVIDRLDSNMLQGGVVGVICVAIISIFLVIVYAIYYRVTRSKRRGDKQGHPESGES